jgi:copper chaperone CopZ
MSAQLLAAAPQRVVLQITGMNGPLSARQVTAAVNEVDPLATVRVDLEHCSIDIVSAVADAYDFADAIASTGCTPVLKLWHTLAVS